MPADTDNQTVPLGTLCDRLYELRESIKELTDREKELRQEFEAIHIELINRMDNEGTPRAGGRKASVSINETTYATIRDYDAFINYVKEEDAFHLLQRRVADASYREMLQIGEEVPGLEPFTRRKLNIRKS